MYNLQKVKAIQNNEIAIFGAGYVGLSTAAILSNTGYKIHLIEVNPIRLKTLKTGESFFYEQGINELLAKALKNGNLIVTGNNSSALKVADVIFSCVGTPDNPDGSPNLQYVFEVAETVSKKAKEQSIFVQKSTVPVGTGKKIEELFHKEGRSISYASNPEFLREGTAILDTLFFDRIVVGSEDANAAKAVMDIYRSIEKNRTVLAKIASIKTIQKDPGKYIRTTRNSAELTKVTANAFLALKISFANSIARLSDVAGADVIEVMDAVGADNRIGRAFLNAGRGYGGGCFPKDVSGLISSAEQYGIDMPILTAAQDVNESMPGYIANKAKQAMGTLKDKKVAVLGLAFKAGTSDTRKSPGVKIANIITSYGAIVRVYDPKANKEAAKDLLAGVTITKSIGECLLDADVTIITTDWDEFISIESKTLKKYMAGSTIIDAVNSLDSYRLLKEGWDYIGVGRQL